MNILVIIPPKFAGCGFYRLYQPFNHLAKNYPCKVTFASALMKSDISAYTDEELKDFDVIIWHKTYFELPDIKRCRSLGIITIADFDDHWIVNREHSLYGQYTKEGLPARLHKMLLNVDYVTCTTERLADAISDINDNVAVLANAIDGNYDGFKVNRVKEEKYIFGYLGGPCHVRDLGLLRGLQAEMTLKLSGYELRLFGYNETDIYKYYARILSDEKRSENFTLYKGADIFNYPQFYNLLDCSLIPLEDNYFNSHKSELKLLEAGAFYKACIVSDVKPYDSLIRHKKNCLAVQHKQDWFTFTKMLLDNRNLSLDLGEQLHEDTRHFDISVINKKRFQFLEQCIIKQQSYQMVTAL
jgi:hypothetical protein